jgi:transmembrane sensor
MTDEQFPDETLFEGWSEADRHVMRPTLEGLNSDVLGAGAFDQRAHWTRVAAATTMTEAAPQPASQRMPEDVKTRRRFLWLAGCAAAAIVTGSLAYNRSSPSAQERRYETTPGQRSAIQLADGSRMMLGPATVTTVTDSGIAVRGEAYFTVVPDSKHPFIVRTENAVVRVLGTRFAVRQYPSESESRVIVEDGRVALARTGGAQSILSARMLGVVTDSGTRIVTGNNTEDYLAWTRGVLSFNKTMLRDVAAELSRAYGVKVRIEDSTLAEQRVSLQVSLQQSFVQILVPICDITEAHVSIKNGTYVLVPGVKPVRVPDGSLKQPFITPEKQYGR